MENCRTQNLCADWEDKLKKLRLDDSGPRPGQRTKRNRDATVPINAFSRMMMNVGSENRFSDDVKKNLGVQRCGVCRQPNTDVQRKSSDHAMTRPEMNKTSNTMQTLVKCHHCEQNIGVCCARSCDECDSVFCIFCTTLICLDNEKCLCFPCHDGFAIQPK